MLDFAFEGAKAVFFETFYNDDTGEVAERVLGEILLPVGKFSRADYRAPEGYSVRFEGVAPMVSSTRAEPISVFREVESAANTTYRPVNDPVQRQVKQMLAAFTQLSAENKVLQRAIELQRLEAAVPSPAAEVVESEPETVSPTVEKAPTAEVSTNDDQVTG
jgi:hypothetical protein